MRCGRLRAMIALEVLDPIYLIAFPIPFRRERSIIVCPTNHPTILVNYHVTTGLAVSFEFCASNSFIVCASASNHRRSGLQYRAQIMLGPCSEQPGQAPQRNETLRKTAGKAPKAKSS